MLLSRKRLRREDYLQKVLYNNSLVRPEEDANFDKAEDWLDYVNLSITHINAYFFRVSENWHRNNEIWWVILSFDPNVVLHDGVYFATTNNKYEKCKRMRGLEGFERLF